MLKSLSVSGLLSFGKDSSHIPLKKLNVLIGPNGSGKSNVVETFSILQAAPKDLVAPIREGGGVIDWLWKGGDSNQIAKIEVLIENKIFLDSYFPNPQAIRYCLSFGAVGQRLEVFSEKIENENPEPGKEIPYFFYSFDNGRAYINIRDVNSGTGIQRELKRDLINPEQSILSQRKDVEIYPEITRLSDVFQRISIYRNWSFGRYTPPRLPQKSDLPNDFLAEDASNLSLVLNKLRRDPVTKKLLLEKIKLLYEEIDDFEVNIEGGTVQVWFTEGKISIPATRLSDGTLRFICLLAVLCHPSPPPLICFEEPELGLHPDLIPELAQLLVEASSRTQLIVTTHSDALINALSQHPESVIVCEKHEGQTRLLSLNSQELCGWLENFRLGQLWLRGDLGGTRW